MIPTECAAEMKLDMLDEMDRMSRHLWVAAARCRYDHGMTRRQAADVAARRV